MTNYEPVRIGDLGKVVTGKTPKTDTPEYFGNDHMFIGPSDLHKHFFITFSERMVSTKGLESIKGSVLNGVSVLVGCIGWDMGNVAIVEGRCATNQQINSITNVHDKYNPLYVYYWLKNKKDFLFQQASVTRTPILNKTNFSNITINIPQEREYQDLVVHLLATIDKKIELNNRINSELEAMAKTLYEYWFVQFDFPDANGKPYKSSGGKILYNPVLKREIPEEWCDSVLGDLINLERGVTYGKEDVIDKENPKAIGVLRATNVTGNIVDIDDLVYVPTSLVSDSQTIKAFETIIVMSSGSKDHVGKNGVYYFEEPLGYGAFCSKISPKKGKEAFVNTFLQSIWFRAYIKNQCLGTNINNLTGDHINKCPIVLPSTTLIEKFEGQAGRIYKKIALNANESQKLRMLRDWLLPMLMNGQVTVKPSLKFEKA